MKLLHVTPFYLPATRYGGPIHSVHGLCKALAARGHDVTVLTTSVNGPHDSPVDHDAPVLLDGVKIRYHRSTRLRRIYFSRPLVTTLQRLLPTHDLVHSHCIFQFPSVAAARLAWQSRTPFVLAPRGMLVPEMIAMKSPLVKRSWIRLFERRHLANADAVHFTTALEQSDFARLGLETRQQWIVPNGIDVATEPTPPAEGGGEILFIGRVNWKKGIDRLIRALQHLPAARLVIAGNDEENYLPLLQSIAAECGVATRVRFVGYADAALKAELLRGASVLAVPSHSENFGNVVLEGWSACRPVIVTPGVGLAEAVTASGGGLVSPGEPAALAGAIQSLLSAPDQAATMGRRGWQYARAQFAWPAVAAQMEARYQDVLSKRPGTR